MKRPVVPAAYRPGAGRALVLPQPYRPQRGPTAQSKTATVPPQPKAAFQSRPAAAVPPVYRPQPVSHALQAKTTSARQVVEPRTRGPRTPPAHRPAGAIQRKIVVADAPSDDVGRMVAVANMMERYHESDPCYLKDADLSQMTFGETLFVSAHGSPTGVGRMSAAAFAKELLRRGLQSGTRIDLRACSSGVFTQGYGTFTEQLASEIESQSGGSVVVFVEGYTGTGVIQEQGSYRAKDSTLNAGELRKEYLSIVGDAQKTEWPAAQKYLLEALSQGKKLSEIAPKVKQMTTGSFSKLYAHNLKVLKSLDSGKTSSSLAHYLGEMDPQWAGSDDMLDRIRADEQRRWANKPASYFA